MSVEYWQNETLLNHINRDVALDEYAIDKLSNVILFKELNKKEFLQYVEKKVFKTNINCGSNDASAT